MAEFPLTLQPMYGGYGVHHTGCDCEEMVRRPGDPKLAPVRAASSVADLVAKTIGTHGSTTPVRVVRYPCANNVPMEEPAAFTWTERHQLYVNWAARAVWLEAKSAHRRARNAADRMEASRNHDDGSPRALWVPDSEDLKSVLLHGYRATLYAICVDGVGLVSQPAADDACNRIIMQTEAALTKATDLAIGDGSEHGERFNRFFHETQQIAAADFIRDIRHALAKVHTHRAMRDAVA